MAGPPCRRQCHGGRPGTPGCSPTSPKWSAVGLVGILASDASPWGALAGGTGAAFGPTNLHRRTHRRGFVHPGQRGLEDHPRPGGPRPPPWPLLPRIGHLGPGLGQRLAYSRVICGANNLCGRASDRMLDGRWRYDAVTVLRPTRPAHLRRRSVPRRRPPGSRSAKLLRWFSEKAVRFGPMAAGPDRVSEPHNTTAGRAVFVHTLEPPGHGHPQAGPGACGELQGSGEADQAGEAVDARQRFCKRPTRLTLVRRWVVDLGESPRRPRPVIRR